MTGTVITAPTIGQDPWGSTLNAALAALQTQFQERIRATQTTSYTAVLADKGTVVEMNKATAGTFTVPPHSSVAFNADTILEIENIGAGTITITPGAAVTVNGTPLTISQYSKAFLRQTGTSDTWVAFVLSPVDLSTLLTVSAAAATYLTSATAATTYETIAAATTVVKNRQTASYTLVLSDQGKCVEMNVASANTLTVPPNSSVAFPSDTVIEGFQYGAGTTTITAGAGVTIRSFGSKIASAGQYAGWSLRKIGTDEWALVGSLT